MLLFFDNLPSIAEVLMPLSIYNSLSGKKEEFVPLAPGKVAIYVCGITAYDYSHIGHARAYVAFDVIYRYLKYKGYAVTYVRNFTDIDDKIIKRANESGQSTGTLSERFIQEYHEDMDALGILRPDVEPRATGTIPAMIELISRLFDKGYAYRAGDDVAFSVKKFAGYGKLSGKKIDELESGARVDVDDKKQDPLDFILWKAAKPGEPSWESPWGAGRPGWHIECSAMSGSILGDTIDIHGGGKDLIFPHHENEIAQSEAATGKPFVRYFLHNGFVNIDSEKMSKSTGKFFTVRDIRKQYHPEVIRLFLLSVQYRNPIDFSEKNLHDAGEALDRLYATKARVFDPGAGGSAGNEVDEAVSAFVAGFIEAMDDDFNTALVLGRLFDLFHLFNRVLDRAKDTQRVSLTGAWEAISGALGVLGILGRDPSAYFEEVKGLKIAGASLDPADIERLIAERNAARKAKDFARADDIRDRLTGNGVILEDGAGGTTWKLK
jgi:cysteinyl-tRNA synthetase